MLSSRSRESYKMSILSVESPSSFVFCCRGVGFSLILLAAAFAFADETKNTQTPEKNAEEAAIRAMGDAFVDAFNRGDAKALAAQWTENGTLADERGVIFKGRKAIEKEYSSLFKAYPGVRIEIVVQSIEYPSSNVAIEDGFATAVTKKGAPPSASRYSAVHLKEDGKWLMASVRESSVPIASNYSKLQDLEWLLGTWEAQSGGTAVRSEIRWIANKSFLERKYTVKKNGIEDSSGVQIVGWDPQACQIKSWTFDSNGGHGTGIWSAAPEGWDIKSSGVLPDGTATSSQDVLIRIPGEEKVFGWRSTERKAGQIELPDSVEVSFEKIAEK
jgi:uncharacterized protein (TIGR02246 family)